MYFFIEDEITEDAILLASTTDYREKKRTFQSKLVWKIHRTHHIGIELFVN
jgi:hypothetical protein